MHTFFIFCLNILSSCYIKTGKGLGKNEDGITEALRPALKFNNLGVGCSLSDSNQWWEHTFNKAAKNINVTTENGEISISLSNENSNSTKELKKENDIALYKNFHKTATFHNGHLISENKSDQEIQNKEVSEAFKVLTDEELFKACGGRTAHKGARHGLKLKGKLERITMQESRLCGKNEEKNLLNDSLGGTFKKSKKLQCKERKRIKNLANQLNKFSISDNSISIKESSEKISKVSSKCKKDKDKKCSNNFIKNSKDEEADDNTDYNMMLSEKHEACENVPKRLKFNDKYTMHKNDEIETKGKRFTKRKKKKKSSKANRDLIDKYMFQTDENVLNNLRKTKKNTDKGKSRSLENLHNIENEIFVGDTYETSQKTYKNKCNLSDYSDSVLSNWRKNTNHDEDKLLDEKCIASDVEVNETRLYKINKANEVHDLNHKINKKKRKKRERKFKKFMENLNKNRQEKKLDTITQSLMAVGLTDNVSKDISKRIEKKKKQEASLE